MDPIKLTAPIGGVDAVPCRVPHRGHRRFFLNTASADTPRFAEVAKGILRAEAGASGGVRRYHSLSGQHDFYESTPQLFVYRFTGTRFLGDDAQEAALSRRLATGGATEYIEVFENTPSDETKIHGNAWRGEAVLVAETAAGVGAKREMAFALHVCGVPQRGTAWLDREGHIVFVPLETE